MRFLTGAKGALVGVMALLAAACATPQGNDPISKRQSTQEMRSDTLTKLYALHPEARGLMKKSAGYAVFSNVGVNVLLVSAGNGWGVVRDNKTGRDTYMKMVSAGFGPGLGAKDFRGVFIFTDRTVMKRFVDQGWDASGQADVAAKSGGKGEAFAGAIDIAPGIKLYQITETGLALQATIQGTQYRKDKDLNG